MSIADIEKMRLLLLARAEINAFLHEGYNEPGSMSVDEPSGPDKAAMKKCIAAYVALSDMKEYRPDPDTEELGEQLGIFLPRTVLDRALRREFEEIERELRAMGADIPPGGDQQ